MSAPKKSGIQTSVDGSSYIPSSRRADGSTRKEIRVRPGWTPQEDVETYKSRNAEAWRSKAGSGVPGMEADEKPIESANNKNKAAKRREATRKRQAAGEEQDSMNAAETLSKSMNGINIGAEEQQQAEVDLDTEQEAEVERQKKIRNQLKKLKAIRELKTKKVNGEKLSPDQLMKLGKEEELLRDLRKLGYEEPKSTPENGESTTENGDG